MKELIKLFVSFFKIGILTFGGGYTMLPMLERETVQKNQWVSNEELLDYYALGQVIPGIIAINTANFIGQKAKGRLGGIASVFGMLAPSILIISIIYFFLLPYMDAPWVQQGFQGIRVAVSALVLDAVIKMGKKGIIDLFTLFLFLACTLVVFFTTINPILPVLIGAVLGIAKKKVVQK